MSTTTDQSIIATMVRSFAEIIERMVQRHDDQGAEHERKLAEHRASFGARTEADAKIIAGLREERDGLLTQVQDMRAEIERLRADIAEELNESPPMPTIKRSHPVKVGEWVRRTSEPYGGVSIGTIGKVLGFAAEHYSIAVEQCWYFKYCEPCDPPGSTHAEPDLTQLHAKGKEAWSDVPNATHWVEDMRGNTEATHDTPAGKEAAEAVIRDSRMTEIEVGTKLRLCKVPMPDPQLSGLVDFPWDAEWGSVGDVAEVINTLNPASLPAVAVRLESELVVWWPRSCIEIVRKVPQ